MAKTLGDALRESREKQKAQAEAEMRSRQRQEELARKAAEEAALLQKDLFERFKEGLRLSIAAYSEREEAKRHLSAIGYHSSKYESTWYGAEGFCCIRNRQAFLSFCGTDSLIDVLIDLIGVIPWYRPPVHSGFGRSWYGLRRKSFDEWLLDHSEDFDTIGLYGHSLGGAIAQVAALDLAADYAIREVVTFGSPRFGFFATPGIYDKTRADDCGNTLKDVSFRVVNGMDIVSKVPFNWMGYQHAGQLVYLDQQGNIKTDREAEETQASEGILKTIKNDLDKFWKNNKPFSAAPPGKVINNNPPAYQSRIDTLLSWSKLFAPLQTLVYYIVACFIPLIGFIVVTWYFRASSISHIKTKYAVYFPTLDVIDELPPEKKSWLHEAIKYLLAVPLGGAAILVYVSLLYVILRYTLYLGIKSIWLQVFG